MEQSGQNLKWRQPRCVSSLPISPPTCRHFPRNNRRHTSSLTKNQGVKNIKSFKISPVFWSTGGGKTIKIEMIEIDLTQKQSPLENSILEKILPSATSASALNPRRPSVSISEIVTEYFCYICWFPIILTFYQLQSFLDLFSKDFDLLQKLLARKIWMIYQHF